MTVQRNLVLKRTPIGDNQDDYDVLEDGVIVGRGAERAAGSPLDVGDWSRPTDTPRSARLCRDAQGRDGRLR
jgi:hypothetical protein